MEKWAKSMNQKKDSSKTTSTIVNPTKEININIGSIKTSSSASEDIAFSMLHKKQNLSQSVAATGLAGLASYGSDSEEGKLKWQSG